MFSVVTPQSCVAHGAPGALCVLLLKFLSLEQD
uniref:D2Ertd391e protein n=1 Tax=Mus musculus TaxID=10090 RepID=Q8K1C4_MOUSE|nr:D2Ertd391e protein [Mus musculus]